METVVSVMVVKLPVAMAINGLFSALMTSVSPTAMPISVNAVLDLTTDSINQSINKFLGWPK